MTKVKGKMHELLAVESAVNANYQRDLAETLGAFKKGELFAGLTKSLKHFDDSLSKLDETQHKAMTTTVSDRFKWFKGVAAALYDVQLQKDKTNQTAKADLVIDDKVLVADVPATTLLMLETRLQEIRRVIEEAPTLPPGTEWEPAPDVGAGVWKTVHEVKTFKTVKTTKPVVLYAATDKHPAQVEKVTEDVPVGTWITSMTSGAISTAQKAELFGRLDKLLKAAKVARQRANSAEADSSQIGETVLGYVFG